MSDPDLNTAPSGIDLAQVPVGTFRHFIEFIDKQGLWDEATALLQSHGIKSIVIGSTELGIVREFVTSKGAALNNEPRHAGTLVLPECSLVCPQPKVPVSPGPGGAPDGGSDAGHPR